MSDATSQAVPFEFAPKHPKGICSVCGEPAWDGRATKCAEHDPKQRANKTGRGTVKEPRLEVGDDGAIRVDVPPPNKDKSAPDPPKDTEKGKRADELERSILNDLNPKIPQLFAQLCRPVPPENFYTVDERGNMTPTEFGRSVMFTDFEAKTLSRSVAELEKSPIVQGVAGTLTPMAPYFWAILGVGVAAYHGFVLVTTRQNILLAYQAQLKRDQMQGEADQAMPMGPAADPMQDFIPSTNGSKPPLVPEYREDQLG